MSVHGAPPAMTRLWKCSECGAELRLDAGNMVPPACGYLSRDMQRFPDGGWMHVEQYTPHPDMEPVEDSVEHRFHPSLTEMSEQVAEARIVAMQARAEASVKAANEKAGIDG